MPIIGAICITLAVLTILFLAIWFVFYLIWDNVFSYHDREDDKNHKVQIVKRGKNLFMYLFYSCLAALFFTLIFWFLTFIWSKVG